MNSENLKAIIMYCFGGILSFMGWFNKEALIFGFVFVFSFSLYLTIIGK